MPHATVHTRSTVGPPRSSSVGSGASASDPIHVTAEARFIRNGVKVTVPGLVLFVAHSNAGAGAFASTGAGDLVQLASLGRRSAPWIKGTVTTADRDAIRSTTSAFTAS